MNDLAQSRDVAMELYRSGRFEEAAEQFGQAYQAHLAQGDWAAAARAANNRGVCLRQAAQFDEAEKAFGEARAIFQQHGDLSGAAQTMGNLATLYESRGNEARAIELYRETAKLLEQCNEPNLSRDTWLALGRLRLRRREWPLAFAAYEMGLSTATELTATQRALRALLKIARRVVWKQ